MVSQIDVYKHECVGMIRCGFFDWNVGTPHSGPSDDVHVHVRWIPIYRLHEDAESFNAKSGDILVGGGSGEASALLIVMPEAIRWFTDDDYDTDHVYESIWSTIDCYEFGVGYVTEGWNPVRGHGTMESFVTGHVLTFLLKNYPEYKQYLGETPLERDGSICRLPTEEERVMGLGLVF